MSEEDSDVILRVGDQQYPAHKVIIRNRSSVFRAMLDHDMTEKKEGIVDIEDCDPYIFRDFLLYLYSGKLDNISNENVFELYYISDKYDVNQLKLDCVDYIENCLNIDIICDVIALAIKHSEQNLLKHATEFFMENAEEIFITMQWQKFLKENPVQANELIIKAFKNDSRKQKPAGQKH